MNFAFLYTYYCVNLPNSACYRSCFIIIWCIYFIGLLLFVTFPTLTCFNCFIDYYDWYYCNDFFYSQGHFHLQYCELNVLHAMTVTATVQSRSLNIYLRWIGRPKLIFFFRTTAATVTVTALTVSHICLYLLCRFVSLCIVL